MKTDLELYSALEDIHYKYERLQALISILQQFIEECVDIVGVPENAVNNSLYEIELGLMETNKKLSEIISQGAMIRKEASEQELKSA